jgi:hypothetical protein
VNATPDTTITTLPAPPPWTRTTTPIELGREFSASFGEETSDGKPPFTVELVQAEYIDDECDPVALRRAQPRLFVKGNDYSPDQAVELVRHIRMALAALNSAATLTEAEPGRKIGHGG